MVQKKLDFEEEEEENKDIEKQEKKSKLDLDKLKPFLMSAANILRGSIDSAEYKHYIFGLLFIKRLNELPKFKVIISLYCIFFKFSKFVHYKFFFYFLHSSF